MRLQDFNKVIVIKLYLRSTIPPSVNHYLSYRAVIKNGKAIGMSYVTQEAARYKKAFTQYVIDEVAKQGWYFVPNKFQHFYVDAVFYFDRTDKDCNNYFKVMLDAITDAKVVWLDDNVVCERVQRIYYDSQDPRVELTIYPVDYIGVFDNTSQLTRFKDNCVGCTRYTRNCALLKKAMNGYIQPEIHDGICEKFKQAKVRKENNELWLSDPKEEAHE